MRVLVTGGTGFIGSHTVVELILAGHTVVILDNLTNSKKSVLDGIRVITNKTVTFIEGDIRDHDLLKSVCADHEFDAVIHFAALKAVGESIAKPLLYYENNVVGLITLLDVMHDSNIRKLIFSSSAAVYGAAEKLPLTEDSVLPSATNPYGATKQMCERIITDSCASGELQTLILRYFNPVGAHPSGAIGELPLGVPNNLVPFIAQTAAGLHKELTVYGNDFETRDGTCVRDYIHVVDLAQAHVTACEVAAQSLRLVETINIGTGRGHSVLEVIRAFEDTNNVKIPKTIGPRRSGDVAASYGSVDKAEKLLGWKAKLSLEDAMRDAWNWQQKLENKPVN